MSQEKFNLASFTGKMKVLHLSWIAFFITFVVWFNFAPLKSLIVDDLGLNECSMENPFNSERCVNHSCPCHHRRTYRQVRPSESSTLRCWLSVPFPCLVFALADNFVQLAIARFALGFIGAGFVIGIRMVSEWFPPKELGTAEGIYGGWGNFRLSSRCIYPCRPWP